MYGGIRILGFDFGGSRRYSGHFQDGRGGAAAKRLTSSRAWVNTAAPCGPDSAS